MPIEKPEIDIALLKRLHLFSLLSDEQLTRVLNSTRRIHVKEDQQLVTQGQTAKHFFLVVFDQITLFLLSEDGNEKTIDLIGPGRLFGEAVMCMKQHRYPVNAAALITPETLSRILRTMTQADVISMRGREVRIPNVRRRHEFGHPAPTPAVSNRCPYAAETVCPVMRNG